MMGNQRGSETRDLGFEPCIARHARPGEEFTVASFALTTSACWSITIALKVVGELRPQTLTMIAPSYRTQGRQARRWRGGLTLVFLDLHGSQAANALGISGNRFVFRAGKLGFWISSSRRGGVGRA